jgi:hypothetical protein
MKRLIKIVLMIVAAASIAYFLIGGNFGAQWNVVDDHMIVGFLGEDQKVKVGEIPGLLQETEVAHFGESARFRPSFWVMYLWECILWGNNIFLWYFARFCILAFFIYTFWRISSCYINELISILIILLFFCFNFWIDIWTRLGPSEIYGVLGISIVAWGYYGEIGRNKYQIINWVLVSLGSIILFGSKENFLIFLLPLILLLVRNHYIKRKSLWGDIIAASAIGYGVWVMTSLGLYFDKHKFDYYANEIAINNRIGMLKKWFEYMLQKISPGILLGLEVIILLLFLGYILGRKNFSKKKLVLLHQIFIKTLLLFIGCTLLVLTQVIFYNGSWPTSSRYDFPGMLVVPITLMFVFWAIKSILKVFSGSAVIFAGYTTIFSTLLLLLICHYGYNSIREASLYNVEQTNRFTNTIEEVKRTTSKDSFLPIVFESGRAMDFEAVDSVHKFLMFSGVNNPVYLRMHEEVKDRPVTELENDLTGRLMNISINGTLGRSGFRPINGLKSKMCVSINFHDYNDKTNCELVIDLL